MRKFLLLLLILPALSDAQINRSATELAQENIREYLVTKIFKDHSYQPVSYSELKEHKTNNSEITWTIRHRFKVTEAQQVADKNSPVLEKIYSFFFYLDKKLKIIKAESSQLN